MGSEIYEAVEVIGLDAELIASLELYRTASGEVKGFVRTGAEPGMWIDVPEMYAAQLPMAITMMKSMQVETDGEN